MLIMNYEDPEEKARAGIEKSFGKKFRAHTDVANCFGSIYTHSLEWATQGFAVAKANLGNRAAPKHWSAELDAVLRKAKRNETSGLPVGPASSSIAVEIILATVDRKLADRYIFLRYVDDYTAYCNTYEEAQDFIRELGQELSFYRLSLNLTKTSIVSLPEPSQDRWVNNLMNAAAPQFKEDGQIAFITAREALQFLDHAVWLNNDTPDGSIVKFAVASIVSRVKDNAAVDVFQYVLNLAWHFPILLPLLEQIDARSQYYDKDLLAGRLEEIIQINSLHRRSDGMSWALYYLERINSSPSERAVNDIIQSNDSVAIAMLVNFPTALPFAISYAKTVLEGDLYLKDQNWLLLYQLFRMGELADAYPDEGVFAELKNLNVDFFCRPNDMSLAEEYSSQLANPFFDDDEIPTFDAFMGGAKFEKKSLSLLKDADVAGDWPKGSDHLPSQP